MPITAEDLAMMRAAAKARSEQIARRKREIEVLRRALWLRIDLVEAEIARFTSAAPGPVAVDAPVRAAAPIDAAAEAGARVDAATPGDAAEPAAVQAPPGATRGG